MEVLFVHQPVKHPIRNDISDVGIPLGMLYLAGYLRDHNSDVNVTLRDYRLHGEDTVYGDITNADVVLAGASTADYSDAIRILSIAKRLGKRTVMGGIIPTMVSDHVLNTGVVDIVVRGEGEQSLSEVFKTNDLIQVQGISYRSSNGIVHNSTRAAMRPEEFSLPDYDVAGLEDYVDMCKGTVYSARGCPMGCSFCTLNTFWRYSYRPEAIDQVLQEVTAMHDAGFKDIRFKDEDFPLNKRRTYELLTALESLGLDAEFKAKARIDRVTPELLEKMQRAGFRRMYCGLEAITPETLQTAEKGYRKGFQEQLDLVLASGLQLEFGFILGLQGETEETLAKNVEYVCEIGSLPNVVPRVTFLTPYPGTKLYNNPVGLRFLTHDWDRYNSITPVCVPESLGANALQKLVEAHAMIVEATGSADYNPDIDVGFLSGLEVVAAK